MKNTLLKIATILVFGYLISSCSPEDGKDGAVGATGASGTNGMNGQTGTANVIYSNWINQNWNSENTTFSKIMRIPAPQITTEILNTGVILCYFRFSDQVNARPIPYEQSGSINIKKEFFPFTNNINIYAFRVDTSFIMQELNLNGTATSIPQYRYIIIPGGVLAGRGTSQPDYTKMSYHEICLKFNIPE